MSTITEVGVRTELDVAGSGNRAVSIVSGCKSGRCSRIPKRKLNLLDHRFSLPLIFEDTFRCAQHKCDAVLQAIPQFFLDFAQNVNLRPFNLKSRNVARRVVDGCVCPCATEHATENLARIEAIPVNQVERIVIEVILFPVFRNQGDFFKDLVDFVRGLFGEVEQYPRFISEVSTEDHAGGCNWRCFVSYEDFGFHC
jgi:hypothetical protein